MATSTPVIKIFRPVAVGTEDTWQLFRGTDKIVAVDPLEPISHDENASAIQEAGASGRQSYEIDRNFPDSMGLVTDVSVYARYFAMILAASKIKVGVALTGGPTFVESADLSTGQQNWGNVSASLARPGGGAWVEADFKDTTFQFFCKLGTGVYWIKVTSLWLAVTYDPTDESRGAIPPEFPSRKLRRSRLPVGVLNSTFRGDALDIDLLTDFVVSHSEGPKDGGKGWGEKDWERRHFRCFNNVLNLNEMTVQLTAIDLYDYWCMFWHTGIAPYNIKSDETFPDGPAVLTPGSTETFARASKGWLQDGSGIIVEFSNAIKRVGPDGILIEGAATNYIINSAFFDDYTGWTRSTPGQISLDTDNTLYEPKIADDYGGTNQTLKLLYDDGVGGCHVHRTSIQVFGEFHYVAFSLWHKDSNASFPPRVSIQNTVTGKYWKASTETWEVAAIENDMTGRTIFGRSFMILKQDPDNASTLKFFIRSPSSPGSGDTHSYIGQVQVEWQSGLFPEGQQEATSAIPTFDGTITRAGESLKFSNNRGRRVWPSECGTMIVSCKIFWSEGQDYGEPNPLPVAGLPLLLAYYNADNWAYLSIGQPGNILKFTIKADGAGGVDNFAYVNPFEVVENQTYVVAARWTSDRGELDLPAYTLSVFLDGAKGVDSQATGFINQTSTGTFNIGTPETGFGDLAGLPQPLIAFSHIEVLPWCLTDEEIKARP